MAQNTSMDIAKLCSARAQIHRLGIQQQREEIRKASPYSSDITSHIRIYNELRLYHSLHLQKAAAMKSGRKNCFAKEQKRP